MEFGWSEGEIRYRRELNSFLRSRLPASMWVRPTAHHVTPDEKAAVIEFNGELAERGWLTPHWPKEYGGQGATPWQHVILGEELWSIGEPRGPQYMNVNWIGPAIMAYGTAEQKEYHLGRISRGDVFWCQGFSEPDAGTDLASLRTAAVRDGEEYVVNGQKIWTSHCQVADWFFVLVRTDPDVAKTKGISILLIPVDTPGIEIRTIQGVVGEGAFHEVFLTDVRVSVANRLGDENGGWEVVRRTLANERVGSPRWERASLALDAVASIAKEKGRFDEPGVRERLGEAKASCEAARLLAYRVIDERAHGAPPTAVAYVARVAMIRAERLVGELALDVAGLNSVEGPFASEMFFDSLVGGVAAGATEVQLNLIAAQLLGLPRS